jgi:lysophospholipase L1-like esterase
MKPLAVRLLRRLLASLVAVAALAGAAAVPRHRPQAVRPGRKPRRPIQPAPKPGGRAPRVESTLVNAKALRPFLEALAGLETPEPGRVVRVLQFGDSHTAADYWSGQVRRRLQARFGDGGFGCLLTGRPWRGYPHDGVRILSGVHWPAQSLRGADCDGLVGLAGASVAPAPGQAFELQAPFAAYRVQLLGPGGALLQAWTEAPAAGETEAPPNPVPVPRLGTEPMPGDQDLETFGQDGLAVDTPRKLGLIVPGASRLLGVELFSGHPGVVYDELGLNGAEILDLARWNRQLRRALLGQAHPDLLVLAYGTNDMGRSVPDQAGYREAVRDLLLELREESGAPILVVGPLDRLGVKKRQRANLKAGAAWVVGALRTASLEAGCAFWDARQAMGGYGALLKWRRAGLAQPDLVHLNGAGYQKLGNLMADQLLEAYGKSRKP